MRTETPKANQIKHDWYLVDATDQVLGRLATKVASIIRGKNKPYFSPHLDTGDYARLQLFRSGIMSDPKMNSRTARAMHTCSST